MNRTAVAIGLLVVLSVLLIIAVYQSNEAARKRLNVFTRKLLLSASGAPGASPSVNKTTPAGSPYGAVGAAGAAKADVRGLLDPAACRPLAPKASSPCCAPYTGDEVWTQYPAAQGPYGPEMAQGVCPARATTAPRAYPSAVTLPDAMPTPAEMPLDGRGRQCGPGLTSSPYADWQAAHGAPVGASDYLDYPGIPGSGALGARGSDVHPTKLQSRGPDGRVCANLRCNGCGDCTGPDYDDLGLPQRWLNSQDALMGIPNGIEPNYYGDHYFRGAGQLNERTHGRVVHLFTPDHEPAVA